VSELIQTTVRLRSTTSAGFEVLSLAAAPLSDRSETISRDCRNLQNYAKRQQLPTLLS